MDSKYLQTEKFIHVQILSSHLSLFWEHNFMCFIYVNLIYEVIFT